MIGLVALDDQDIAAAHASGNIQYLIQLAVQAKDHRVKGRVDGYILNPLTLRADVANALRRAVFAQHGNGAFALINRRDLPHIRSQRQRKITQAAACVTYAILRVQVGQHHVAQARIIIAVRGCIAHEAHHIRTPHRHGRHRLPPLCGTITRPCWVSTKSTSTW